MGFEFFILTRNPPEMACVKPCLPIAYFLLIDWFFIFWGFGLVFLGFFLVFLSWFVCWGFFCVLVVGWGFGAGVLFVLLFFGGFGFGGGWFWVGSFSGLGGGLGGFFFFLWFCGGVFGVVFWVCMVLPGLHSAVSLFTLRKLFKEIVGFGFVVPFLYSFSNGTSQLVLLGRLFQFFDCGSGILSLVFIGVGVIGRV